MKKRRWLKKYELDGDTVTLWREDDGKSVVYYIHTLIDGELNVSNPITSHDGAHDTHTIMENHILREYQKRIKAKVNVYKGRMKME